MKKTIILFSTLLILGSFLASCGHHPCAGVTTQVQKVKVSNSPRPI